MKSRAVVVVGSTLGRRLAGPLSELGLTPELETRFNKVLEGVRKRPHAAIVMKEAELGIDALELALNVRDVDGDVPIIIVCNRNEPHRLLAGVEKLQVFYLRGDVPPNHLARQIGLLLEGISEHAAASDRMKPGRKGQG